VGATAGRADGLTGELLLDFVSMAMSEIKGETFTCLAGGKKRHSNKIKETEKKKKKRKKEQNNKTTTKMLMCTPFPRS
jgi:hypothetical protein